jgi:hypothetical protein
MLKSAVLDVYEHLLIIFFAIEKFQPIEKPGLFHPLGVDGS